jgi:hypothetical protein
MRRARTIRYKLELGCISAVILIWAALFYKNYGQASVVAFGDIAQHLAYLRVILWRYLLVGGALFAVFAAVLFQRSPAVASDEQKVMRRVQEH